MYPVSLGIASVEADFGLPTGPFKLPSAGSCSRCLFSEGLDHLAQHSTLQHIKDIETYIAVHDIQKQHYGRIVSAKATYPFSVTYVAQLDNLSKDKIFSFVGHSPVKQDFVHQISISRICVIYYATRVPLYSPW